MSVPTRAAQCSSAAMSFQRRYLPRAVFLLCVSFALTLCRGEAEGNLLDGNRRETNAPIFDDFAGTSTGSTGSSGATGGMTGSNSYGTGPTGTDESLKHEIRASYPMLSGLDMLRMSADRLKLELEHRSLTPVVMAADAREDARKELYISQLKAFFRRELLDMTAEELKVELTRRRALPTERMPLKANLRQQLNSHLITPRSFPSVGAIWQPGFDTPNANNSCPVTHDCAECTAVPGCGFMSHLRVCLEGNHDGPNVNSLRLKLETLTNKAIVKQFWSYGSCPAAPCSTYRKCGSCLADKYCGWCAGTGTCFEDADGKRPLNGTCDAGWCSHPEQGLPHFFRAHTHPFNPEIRAHCLACEARMQPTDGVNDVDRAIAPFANVTNVTAVAKVAEKKLTAAKADLKKMESMVERAPNVVANVVNLHKAQDLVVADEKLAVNSEARAALAGKDQRELESAQAKAQVKADEAEQAKAAQYKTTESVCDRADHSGLPEDKEACAKARQMLDIVDAKAQTAIRESEAIAEVAIGKTDEANKLAMAAAVAKSKVANMQGVRQRSNTKTMSLTAAIADDVLTIHSVPNNQNASEANNSVAALAEEVKLARVESELADANAQKVALEEKIQAGPATNATKAALALENARIQVALAKKEKESAVARKASPMAQTKALLDLKVARARQSVAEVAQKLASSMPGMVEHYAKQSRLSQATLEEIIAERRSKLAELKLQAAEVSALSGGKSNLDAARRERAAATADVAATMERVAEQNGDSKIKTMAEKEAAIAAEQALMADKLAGSDAVGAVTKADQALEAAMKTGVPEEISEAAKRAHEAEQAVVRYKAREKNGFKPTRADQDFKRSLYQKFLKKATIRLRKQFGLTPVAMETNRTNATSPANSMGRNGTDPLFDLEKLDEEANERAVEIGLSPPKHPPVLPEEQMAKTGENAVAKFTEMATLAEAGGLVFSATLELTKLVCQDWTPKVEGALVSALASYIRVDKNAIALKPQCDTTSRVGILPVDFSVAGKSREDVRRWQTLVKTCLDNSTCPFVEEFCDDIKMLGFSVPNMVISLVTTSEKKFGDEWAAGKLSKDNLKLMFGKAAPQRGHGLKEHIEDQMSYARLLGDRVTAFSAVVDAQNFDHLQMEGLEAKEKAARAAYERAAKYVQYNLSDVSEEMIRTARQQLINATRKLHEVETEYMRMNKSKSVWPAAKELVEDIEPLAAVLEMARGCNITINGTRTTATVGCSYHLRKAEAIVNETKKALTKFEEVEESEDENRYNAATRAAASAAQAKFLRDFNTLQERRAKRVAEAATKKALQDNEENYKRKRALAKYHNRKNEEDTKMKQDKYNRYLAADSVQNKLFEAVENETDTLAAKNMYEARVEMMKMNMAKKEEEEMDLDKMRATEEVREVMKQNVTTFTAEQLAEKEAVVAKAVKISEEEKKAVSKARYEAEMAKNRASAALLKSEKDESEKEIIAAKEEDERDMESLVSASFGSATGMEQEKEFIIGNVRSGSPDRLRDAILQAKTPALRVALEAKLAEAQKLENGSGAIRRTDVQLPGHAYDHNSIGRPPPEDVVSVPTTEDYAARAVGDALSPISV